MAWQYTEYAGCPTFVDLEKQRFRCSIELDVDTTEVVKDTMETTEGPVEIYQFETNNRLRSRYHLRIGENKNSILNLSFDSIGGLRKILWKDEGIVTMGGYDYQASKLQPIDRGTYDDFKLLAEYAVKRFLEIAKEMVMSPTNFPEDISEEQRQEIEEYTEARESFPSWEAMQKDITNDFYHNFQIYLIWESNRKRGLVKRTNPFSEEQIISLEQLMSPLKPKKP